MDNLAELEREVWKHIKSATENHDTPRLAYFSVLAAEIETKKKDWDSRFHAGLKINGSAGHLGGDVHAPPRRTPVPQDGDFTGRPIRGFEFEGVERPVTTYRELLVGLANLLRKKYGDDFDRRAVTLGGRKRRYFSLNPRDLKIAHELEPGGLYVETNLNANLIVKICHSILTELGCDSSKLRIR